MRDNDEGTQTCPHDEGDRMTTMAEQLEAEIKAGPPPSTKPPLDHAVVLEYAGPIRELLPIASRARGVQSSDHPSRQASDEINRLVLEYTDARGGNLTSLAKELSHGDVTITYAGLRRRLRVGRSGIQLGAEGLRKGQGNKDPELIAQAAAEIRESKKDGVEYRRVVRKWYDEGLNLQALSKELKQSYYSLWSLLRS